MGNVISRNTSILLSSLSNERRERISFSKTCFVRSNSCITLQQQYSESSSKTSLLKSHHHHEIASTILLRYDDDDDLIPKTDFGFESLSHKLGNFSVVLTTPTFLQAIDCRHLHLPLGTTLDVLFQYKRWLYVRTAHAEEGYVSADICLPLEACFSSNYSADHTVTMESLKLIYEADFSDAIDFSERNVDILYLQANGIRQKRSLSREGEEDGKFSTRLIIKNDYVSGEGNTLSVKKGEAVQLLHNRVRGWFWVMNEANAEGFVPAAIAGYICG